MFHESETLQELERNISAVASLKDPVRRAIYLYVINCDRAVGRDEAALEFKLERPAAAYHLDKLVEHGLLVVSYGWLSGKRSRGRTSKFYRRSSEQVTVTLPPLS